MLDQVPSKDAHDCCNHRILEFLLFWIQASAPKSCTMRFLNLFVSFSGSSFTVLSYAVGTVLSVAAFHT